MLCSDWHRQALLAGLASTNQNGSDNSSHSGLNLSLLIGTTPHPWSLMLHQLLLNDSISSWDKLQSPVSCEVSLISTPEFRQTWAHLHKQRFDILLDCCTVSQPDIHHYMFVLIRLNLPTGSSQMEDVKVSLIRSLCTEEAITLAKCNPEIWANLPDKVRMMYLDEHACDFNALYQYLEGRPGAARSNTLITSLCDQSLSWTCRLFCHHPQFCRVSFVSWYHFHVSLLCYLIYIRRLYHHWINNRMWVEMIVEVTEIEHRALFCSVETFNLF